MLNSVIQTFREKFANIVFAIWKTTFIINGGNLPRSVQLTTKQQGKTRSTLLFQRDTTVNERSVIFLSMKRAHRPWKKSTYHVKLCGLHANLPIS